MIFESPGSAGAEFKVFANCDSGSFSQHVTFHSIGSDESSDEDRVAYGIYYARVALRYGHQDTRRLYWRSSTGLKLASL